MMGDRGPGRPFTYVQCTKIQQVPEHARVRKNRLSLAVRSPDLRRPSNGYVMGPGPAGAGGGGSGGSSDCPIWTARAAVGACSPD